MLRFIRTDELKYFQESPRRVSERSRRLLEAMRATLPCDEKLTKQHIDKFIVRSGMSSNKTDAVEIICGELAVLQGSVLRSQDRVLLACGIAGSWRCVSMGFAYLHAEDVEEVDVWGKVLDISDTELYGQPGYTLTYVICNSSLAGRRVLGDIRREHFGTMARMSGIRGSNRKQIKGATIRWHGPRQLITSAAILRVSRIAGDLQIVGCGFNSKTAEYNRDLTISRERKLSACPYGANFDCYLCDVGINECERSTVTISTSFFGEKK